MKRHLVDRLVSRIQQNPVGAFLIALGTIVIALSTFTDAATNLLGVISKEGPDAARTRLSNLHLEYTPAAFVESAKRGDLSAVKLFLAAGMDPNSTDSEGITALMYAARARHNAIIDALLKAKANVNETVAHGGTALSWAAATGNIDAVRVFLEHGADPPTIDSAFWIAAESGEPEALRLLLEVRAIPSTVRSQAVLAAAGSSMEGTTDRTQSDVVAVLIDLGADVNAKGDDGWTALLLATVQGRAAVARTLLDHGSDINAQCDCPEYLEGRWSALMIAIERGHRATEGEHGEIVKTLLLRAADVNLRNRRGRTALMLAAETGDTSVVSALLTRGAHPNEKDISGKTALQVAKEGVEGKGRTEVIRLLRQAGAK
jgi:uncharacterized protein